MTVAERFWWLLTMCCVGWYLTVTGYVAVRGLFDIRHMLNRLGQEQLPEAGQEGPLPNDRQ